MNEPRSLAIPPALDVLSASEPVALFLDFDGTLVAIADTPDGIEVPSDLAARLEALAARVGQRLALVSGRSPGNLAEHLGPVLVAIAGSHGMARTGRDGQPVGTPPRQIADAALARIEAAAAAAGAAVERKAHGMALHYRLAPEREADVLAAAHELAATHGLIVKQGKCVAELVPPGGDKGSAVRAFMTEAPFAGTVPVFVGDDVTDEDGFRAATELGGFGIAVGERPSDSARYHLSSVSDVHAWLNL
ncbi:MAG: trehalose-phosphatase [Sphingomonadaceae bacterium]|nr:trehalose-phosphatase [Rhodobiaceae bacterium]MCP5384537.1 trehalose-phosphatase [Altererythrobacter sp.]MCP5391676.1 trehalose-phosphatase [Sphingomonadaceae bacterium]MCP5395065.1 trehalose-phosphatase [Sphingomonadaceae bacterium]